MSLTDDRRSALMDLQERVRRELLGNILPFWIQRSPDPDFGGFRGRIGGDGTVDPKAPKGAVLNARILWTFSALWQELGDTACEETAHRAYQYFRDFFLDREYGGVFWMLDYRGNPLNDRKQVYAQAFAVYGLARYFQATADDEALNIAVDLFRLLEARCRDPFAEGYFEAFARDWDELQDVRLSPRDLNEKKSMNTHLHLLEAYTGLLQVWPDARLQDRLVKLVETFLDRILDRPRAHLQLFFNENWEVRSDVVSFGHDIEASWLLEEAGRVLQISRLTADIRDAAEHIARSVRREGVAKDGSILYERYGDGSVDEDRHWWPQAEGLVGFLNAYELTGEECYLDAVLRLWDFIEEHLVDRENGEWHWAVDACGRPRRELDKVGPWKGPYHNGRACLEVLRRLDSLLSREQPSLGELGIRGRKS